MNFKIMSAIITIVVVLVNVSCQSEDFLVSEDGYQYRYVKKGTGQIPQNGEVAVYNMSYKDENDSLLFESPNHQPAMVPCDTMQWNMMGPLYKAFGIIKEGDSILVKIPTKTLFSESFRAAIPPSLNPEGEITFYIGLTKVLSESEARAEAQRMREQEQAAMLAAGEEQMEKDIEIIDNYLKENDISAQSTESGLRYVVDVEGTGNHPQPGDSVSVRYAGTLLDGTEFDAGVYTFPVGRGQAIQGWDLGVPLFKKGGKGTLYVPSPLAYGPRARSAVIKANSILKFDIELLEIN